VAGYDAQSEHGDCDRPVEGTSGIKDLFAVLDEVFTLADPVSKVVVEFLIRQWETDLCTDIVVGGLWLAEQQ
jgi:hypothetical protein